MEKCVKRRSVPSSRDRKVWDARVSQIRDGAPVSRIRRGVSPEPSGPRATRVCRFGARGARRGRPVGTRPVSPGGSGPKKKGDRPPERGWIEYRSDMISD